MADDNIKQVMQDAITDADSLEQFINGSEDETVLTRLSAEYPTLQNAIKQLFVNGGLPATPFKTKVEMEASELVDGSYAQITDGDADSGLYLKENDVWVKSAYDPLRATEQLLNSKIRNKQSVFDTLEDLKQAGLGHKQPALVVADSDSSKNGLYSHSGSVPYKIPYQPQDISNAYADGLFSAKLAITSNLNELKTGQYYIQATDLNTVFDNGTYTSLGYPAGMERGGGAVVDVVRSTGNGNQSYQTITLNGQGVAYTRYGLVSGSFGEWEQIGSREPNIFPDIPSGLSSVREGELFWVYETESNGLFGLGIYKKVGENSELVFQQVKPEVVNPLEGLTIKQGEKWELV